MGLEDVRVWRAIKIQLVGTAKRAPNKAFVTVSKVEF
jgi:hypothetical protein